MNNHKSKKEKQFLKRTFKDQIQKTAEKLVTDKIQKDINKLKYDEWRTARQRDWFILLSIGLLISNIIFIFLWWLKC